jgi:hypothetical protein
VNASPTRTSIETLRREESRAVPALDQARSRHVDSPASRGLGVRNLERTAIDEIVPTSKLHDPTRKTGWQLASIVGSRAATFVECDVDLRSRPARRSAEQREFAQHGNRIALQHRSRPGCERTEIEIEIGIDIVPFRFRIGNRLVDECPTTSAPNVCEPIENRERARRHAKFLKAPIEDEPSPRIGKTVSEHAM